MSSPANAAMLPARAPDSAVQRSMTHAIAAATTRLTSNER